MIGRWRRVLGEVWYGMAVHDMVRHLQRTRGSMEHLFILITLGDLMPDQDTDFESAEARIMLGPAVRSLAPRDRRILELRFFEGWTQEQIAHDIGVTQMQVSRLLSRILKDLRNHLT